MDGLDYYFNNKENLHKKWLCSQMAISDKVI